MIKCVLFDLDGTLLYTLDTIAYHLNKTLASLSLGSVTVEECSRFIGNGARKLVARALDKNGICDEEALGRVLKMYNESYDSDPIPHTAPYPGVVDLVDELYRRGVILGVVTNKPEPTAQKLVDCFFGGKFTHVRGGREGAILKPDPTDSLDILGLLGLEASECAFVGDTSVDIQTSKNMHASLSIGVSWGFRDREELMSAGADFVADNVDDILRVLAEVL